MRATPFPIAAAILSFALAGPTAQENDESPDAPDLPLEPARTLSLDTDEGTWISVDVSPDGGTIVFDLLGDLYTIPFAGGDATPLTEGMAYDSQPRYSPDGSQVLFVSDRDGSENLWLIDVDSRATRQVTNAPANNYESPEWLPDGDYVVAAVGAGALAGGDRRNPKLWMWHVDGGTGIQLIDEPGSRRITGPAPTPDGRHIWFAQRERLWQYNAIFPQYQLAVYDRETGEQYVRTSRYGSALRPTISPDGAWLVYGTRHEDRTGLRLRELASGDERWLAYPVQRDDQESVAGADTLPGMSFTPDSSALVASYGGKIWRVPVAEGAEPIAVPFRVRTELEIGPELAFEYPVDDSIRFTVRQIRDAVPSPDGRTLAFAALDRLYVRPIPDGEPRRLTELEMVEAQPAWSPDGAWIAFVTWSPEGGHLYKVRADGSAPPVRLSTRPAIFQRPAWSPDGERLVAIQGPARSFREAARQTAPGASANIVSIPAAGGDWTLVAPTDGRSFPHTTTDPDRIFLYHREDGLVSIRWDGTDEKAHVKVNGPAPPGGGDPQPASLVLMAPAGDRALAQVRLDLYALAVPYVGGDAPVVSVANPERASVPVRKLTDVGGQFPAWSADGRRAHWSIGNAHFVYDLDDAAAAEEAARAADAAEAEEDAPADAIEGAPAYEPVEIRVAVDAIRDIPNGYGVLRGGRVVTMRGNEVLENADVVVQGNRILGVGRRGTVEFPDFARVIEVPGTTIVPGFVDTHAHMRPSFGVHKTQPWTYLANLAYGVTTTRDPQTGTTDVLTYGDLVETGDIVGPRIYSTGPGVFNAEQIEDLDHAQRVLRRYSEYYDTQTIKMYMSGNRRQRQWIVMAAKEQQAAADHRGRARHEVRPGDDHRRLPGAGALVPHLPALPRRRQPGRRDPHGLHADAARLLRRAVRRELVLHAREPARRPEAAALHPARRARPADAPPRGRSRRGAGRLVPRGGVRLPAARRGREGHRGGGRRGRGRQPRPAPGPRLPLGAVGHAVGRPVGARRAARRHRPRGGSHRPRRRPRLHRAGQAGRPRRPGGEPARRHPEHQSHPLRDEERPPVRRRHARRDLAARARDGQAGLAGRRAGRGRRRHPVADGCRRLAPMRGRPCG